GLPALYAGSILFPLAVVGLLGRDRSRWPLLALGALGALLWMRLAVLTDVVGKLPLFDISVLDYLVFLGLFALCALAALGAERLASGDGAAAFLVTAALTGAAITAIFLFRRSGMAALLMSPEFLRARLFWELAPLAAAAIVVVAVAARRPALRAARVGV